MGLLNTLQTPYNVLKERRDKGIRIDKTANEEILRCLEKIGYDVGVFRYSRVLESCLILFFSSLVIDFGSTISSLSCGANDFSFVASSEVHLVPFYQLFYSALVSAIPPTSSFLISHIYISLILSIFS